MYCYNHRYVSDCCRDRVVVDGHPRNAEAVVVDIETRIGQGSLRPGDRLEPVRVAAERLGLAPNTVASAYRTLGERGYVVGEGRRGTFVAARPALRSAVAELVPEGVVDLSSGNPDPALLPELGPALAQISAVHALYGDPPIDAELEARMRADLLDDLIPADELALVGGALDGIERVLSVHLRPGDRVAVEDPGYSSVIELVRALGFRPVPGGVDESGPVPDALDDALAGGAVACILTPRAQNPTGAALSPARARDLRRVVADYPDLLLVEDDHAGPVSGQPYLSIASGRVRWAVVRSTAKSLGPDLRVAFLAGDATTVRRVAGRQILGTGWVSHILQRLVVAVLAAPDTSAVLEQASRAYADRRRAVLDVLAPAGVPCMARSGLNVWIPVLDEAAVVSAMQAKGWALRSGARYRIDAGPGVRMSVAGQSPEALEAAARDLLDVLAHANPSRSV